MRLDAKRPQYWHTADSDSGDEDDMPDLTSTESEEESESSDDSQDEQQNEDEEENDSDDEGSEMDPREEIRQQRQLEEEKLLTLVEQERWMDASMVAIDVRDQNLPFGRIGDGDDDDDEVEQQEEVEVLGKETIAAAALTFLNLVDTLSVVQVLRIREDLLTWPQGLFLLSMGLKKWTKEVQPLALIAAWLALNAQEDQHGEEEDQMRRDIEKLLKNFKFDLNVQLPTTEAEVTVAVKELTQFLKTPIQMLEPSEDDDGEGNVPILPEEELLAAPPNKRLLEGLGSEELNSQTQVELLLRRAAHCWAKGKISMAEQWLNKIRPHWEGQRDNLVLLQYLNALLAILEGNTTKASNIVTELLSYEDFCLPEALFLKGLLSLKLKHLNEAMDTTSEAVQMLQADDLSKKRLTWPECLRDCRRPDGQLLFKEADPEEIYTLFNEQKQTIRSHPSPDAICRYGDCAHAKNRQALPYRREIFKEDEGFKGYYIFHCTERCEVAFHVLCHKHYREKHEVTGGSGDWITGVQCFTPDCLGELDHVEVVSAKGDKKTVGRRKIVAAPVPAPPAPPLPPTAVKKKPAPARKEPKQATEGPSAQIPKPPSRSVMPEDPVYADGLRKLRQLRRSVPTHSELLESLDVTEMGMVDDVEIELSQMRELCAERLREISMATVGGGRRRHSKIEFEAPAVVTIPEEKGSETSNYITFYLYALVRLMSNKVVGLEQELEAAQNARVEVSTETRYTQTKEMVTENLKEQELIRNLDTQLNDLKRQLSDKQRELEQQQLQHMQAVQERRTSADQHLQQVQNQHEQEKRQLQGRLQEQQLLIDRYEREEQERLLKQQAAPVPEAVKALHDMQRQYSNEEDLDDALEAMLAQREALSSDADAQAAQPSFDDLDDDQLDMMLASLDGGAAGGPSSSQSSDAQLHGARRLETPAIPECVVCQDGLAPQDRFTVKPCRHDQFHEQCIRSWLRIKSDCPLCRNHIKLDDEYPSLF